ncbi:Callose synthase [Thalictrum thalictroides]|uniref:Callose synthase n=1 Tax=Thalictrum thalictroides TaxID=46969 RepID=A0A7J6V350_THATH|nr:Callose synthase [Thalictrum thalictroides]
METLVAIINKDSRKRDLCELVDHHKEVEDDRSKRVKDEVNHLKISRPSSKKNSKQCRAQDEFLHLYFLYAVESDDHQEEAKLAKAYQTAGVLFEVLCAVNKNEKNEEVAPEIITAARNVQEMNEIYAPYNILPLDAAGASQPIMQFDEDREKVNLARFETVANHHFWCCVVNVEVAELSRSRTEKTAQEQKGQLFVLESDAFCSVCGRCTRLAMVYPEFPKVVGVAGHAG